MPRHLTLPVSTFLFFLLLKLSRVVYSKTLVGRALAQLQAE